MHVVLQSDNEMMDEVVQDPSLLEPKLNEVAKEQDLHLPQELPRLVVRHMA